MYFHLIGIKEKNGKKYDLNLLLQGGDEDFIRKFLANRGVVIVSITEYKEDIKNFGNIVISLTYNNSDIQLIAQSEDLSEEIFFIISLGLRPSRVNFIDNPVADDQMMNMINSAILEAEEEDKKVKEQEEIETIKEKKKYEERGIKDGLKILNANIDRIEQVLKAGEGILSGSEIKELENYSSEMKKIRLGTNFNKMASLVLEAHDLLKHAEKEIIDANAENEFLIDSNSSVTNIDVLKEFFHSNKIMERATLQPASLSTTELITNAAGTKLILLKLLGSDLSHSFSNYSFDELFDVTLKLIEFIVIVATVVVTLLWLIGPFVGLNTASLYLLPAMGWLGLLLYLLRTLKLKGPISSIAGFVILALIYWQGLKLLLNTFAL